MEIKDNILIKIDDNDILTDTLFLENIIEIADSVFENNQIIQKIEAPNLKKINNKAFYNCSNLNIVKAPLLEYIGDSSFYGTNLVNFDFSNVLEIGKNAFEKAKLDEVVLPKTLTKVGKYAFANNLYLVKANIGSNMTKIKDGMFENCINLKDVKFSNTINKFGIAVFKNCKKLNQVELPEHLKVIETNSFWGCESLKKVIFNDEIEVINDYAFGDTKVSSIILPDSIKTIGKLPFHMCYQLEVFKINKLFHNDILDKTNSHLREITIKEDHLELVKPIKKIINYNNLIIIKYTDDSFNILSKPSKYYDYDYFNNTFKNINIKMLLKNDEIFNIFYWESILGSENLNKINPLAIIALPPNINMIKAFFKKHTFYDEFIDNNNLTDFNNILAVIKFLTIFGGLCRKSYLNFQNMYNKIGIRNLSKQFLDTNVKEFNQNFIRLYLKLTENYSFKEINTVMPFLYNNIEKVINLENNNLLDTLESAKFEEESSIPKIDFKVTKSDKKIVNYDWLDTTSTINLLWAYILASVSSKHIDSNEETRKVLTYYIKDNEGLIVASSRAYYSVEEKYLLFNSIVLSQSFINKGYTVEKIKSLIIEYVLASIEDILNFLNEIDVVVSKVHVGLSEKSISNQLVTRGTKVINQNI